MRKAFLPLLPLSLCLSWTDARAAGPEEEGLVVAREADRRDSGWGDYEARMEMTLRDRHGKQSARLMRVRFLEVEGDGDKSLGSFLEPVDIRGTALLTFSHKKESDDQWLYLPALKRVKRIASDDKSGAFMGSEFAYEDVSSQEVEKYRYKLLPDETLDGEPCFVLERVPVSSWSGYTRQVAWIDKSEYRLRKVDYYDRKSSLLKTLTQSAFTKEAGRFWKPGEMRMSNHQTGKSTLIRWSGYAFGIGLKDSDFTQERLKRTR